MMRKGKWETKEDLKKVHEINRHDVSEILPRLRRTAGKIRSVL